MNREPHIFILHWTLWTLWSVLLRIYQWNYLHRSWTTGGRNHKKIYIPKIFILTKKEFVCVYIHTHTYTTVWIFWYRPTPFLCHLSYIKHTLNAPSMISCFHFFKVEWKLKIELKRNLTAEVFCSFTILSQIFYNCFTHS